jgi:hypothetical protein
VSYHFDDPLDDWLNEPDCGDPDPDARPTLDLVHVRGRGWVVLTMPRPRPIACPRCASLYRWQASCSPHCRRCAGGWLDA